MRLPGEFDAATRQAVDFFRRKLQGAHGRSVAGEKYPDIATAVAAWEQPELRTAVQMLVLADVRAAEICDVLKVQESVLQIIESLYFDVRPMLKTAPWIVAKVIDREADAGRDEVAAQLRAAYSYGRLVLHPLLAARHMTVGLRDHHLLDLNDFRRRQLLR